MTIAQQAGRFAFYDIVDTIAKMGYNITFTPDVINIYNSALNRYLSQFGTCPKMIFVSSLNAVFIEGDFRIADFNVGFVLCTCGYRRKACEEDCDWLSHIVYFLSVIENRS